MRSTPSPNPFDRLMGWLRLSRGEGPAWEGWARRACPPVLCSVFVFKRNLLRVSFHSAERFDCAKGRASRDLGPVAQIIAGHVGLGGGGGGEHKRAARWRRDERCAHSTTLPGGTGDVTESIRPCGFVCRTSSPRVLPSFVKLFVETLAAAAGEPRGFCTHRCVLMDQDHSGKTAARVTRAVRPALP